MTDSERVETLAAEHWFGYGRWAAPYWFVGPEPGMQEQEGDNLSQRCQAWAELSGGTPAELIDCYEHHDRFHELRLFTRTIKMKLPVDGRTMRPPMQDTWRRLIALLLGYLGERTDDDAIADYQCEKWGRKDGDTCVVELSALAARNLGVERDRKTFMDNRAQTLHQRLLENEPTFCVLYGRGSIDRYEQVVGGAFDANGYRRVGKTLCAFVEHPVARPGKPIEWWIAEGVKIRELSSRKE